MKKQKLGLIVRLGMAILCFLMAVISFFGVGTKDERYGRLLFGLMWICVGVLCAIRYLQEKSKQESQGGPEREL
ncbi:MAG: hypothetical protein HY770_04820 [Chitinivibrionia bacterium]|nr:hypothetical protein [Chitinivibrionia bacterium]